MAIVSQVVVLAIPIFFRGRVDYQARAVILLLATSIFMQMRLRPFNDSLLNNFEEFVIFATLLMFVFGSVCIFLFGSFLVCFQFCPRGVSACLVFAHLHGREGPPMEAVFHRANKRNGASNWYERLQHTM